MKRIYVNEKYDRSQTITFGVPLDKVAWSKLKRLTPKLLTSLFGIDDVENILNSKSSLTSKALSTLSLFITYFPATKAVKLYKAMDAARLLDKGIETTADLEKVSRAAGLTEKENKIFDKVMKSEEVAGKTSKLAKIGDTFGKIVDSLAHIETANV